MRWIEVAVKTTTQAVDAVSNVLYEAGAQGVSIEDPHDLELMKLEEIYWDYIETTLETRPEGAIVRAYFPDSATTINTIIQSIKEGVNRIKEFGIEIGDGTISVLSVDESQWENQWKMYYHPIRISEKVIIKPVWEEYKPKAHEVVIELDPGMAFGTGSHETTSMCMESIEKYLKTGDNVLDIGCGSGILSILAAKLGANKIHAIDIDPIAVKVAQENILLNNCTEIITLKNGVLEEEVVGSYQIVIANIMADMILSISSQVGYFIKDGGLFISSGIIQSKKEEVIQKLINHNFTLLESFDRGEWCALVAKKGR